MPSKTVTKKNQSTKVLPQKVLPQTVIKFDQVTKQFSKNNQKTFKEFIPALFRGEKTTEIKVLKRLIKKELDQAALILVTCGF